MRVMSWNVQGVFPMKPLDEKIPEQVEFIASIEPTPDVVFLQEVNRNRRGLWRETLREVGYIGLLDTLDWAQELGDSEIPPHHDIEHSNGNITAVQDAESIELVRPDIRAGPFEDRDLKHLDTHFPEKILVSTLRWSEIEIELWNIRAVPGNSWGEEKVKIFETVYNRLLVGGERPRILAGDFNSPDAELADGQIIPFGFDKDRDVWHRYVNAELNILRGLGTTGMIDVFRATHGYDTEDILDVSHPTRTDAPLDVPKKAIEGKRFDHVLASESLNPVNCYYDACGFKYSDHAPIIADFSPTSTPTTR